VFKRHEKSLKGRTTESIIAASIYIACRIENVPRTMKEICALTTVSKKEIGKCVRKMSENKTETFAVIEAKDFLPRFCSHLSLSNDILRATVALCDVVKTLGIAASKSPISVAAAAIYLVTQLSNNPKPPKGTSQPVFGRCLLS